MNSYCLCVCLSVSFPQLWSPLFDLNENWLHSQSNNSFEIQSPAICLWCLWLLYGLNGTFHSIQKAENMSSWLVLPTHPQTSSRFFPIHHQLEVWRNFWTQRALSLLGCSYLAFQSRWGWDSVPEREQVVFHTCYLGCFPLPQFLSVSSGQQLALGRWGIQSSTAWPLHLCFLWWWCYGCPSPSLQQSSSKQYSFWGCRWC